MTTPSPQPGFAPAPVNSTQWNAQVVQAAAEQRINSTKQAANVSGGGGFFSWLLKPVESVGSFVHSVYSNVISRPLSAAMLHMYIGSAEANSSAESWGNLFDGDIWDRAWRDAKHVSPGQAFEFGIENFFGDMRTEMMKPVNYTPKDMAGRPVLDKSGKPVNINLNQTGYIWDNPDAVKVHFDSGVQKYLSGGLDFYTSWYADPFVLAGKGAGIARNVAYVRPALDAVSKPNLAQEISRKVGLTTIPERSNVEKNIFKNRLAEAPEERYSRSFIGMGDMIMKQKGKLGEAFPEWITRQNWAKNSADSGALASALGKAADRSDVDQILAVSLGDTEALQKLTAKNAELGAQMDMLAKRKEGLIAGTPANVAAGDAAKLKLQMDDIAQKSSQILAQRSDISGRIAVQGTMKNGMYFNPLISPIASNFGQYARGLETTSASKLGKGIASAPVRYAASLVYNNAYVRPIRLFSGTTWNGVRAPGHINLDAEDSHRALSASLQQSNAFTNDEVANMVGKYITADRGIKDFLVQQYDSLTVQRLAKKYDLNDAEADAIYKQVGGLRGQARDGRVYSTGYIETADGGRLRADHVAEDGSLVAVSPVLNSQLQNTHILTDYEHMDRILKYSAGPFKKLLKENKIQMEAAKGEPLNLAEQAEAARTAMSELKPSKILSTLNFGTEAADTFSKLWKFNVLLRLGYGPRAIADDFMGQVAQLGAANFFFERTLQGGRNFATRKMNHIMGDPTGVEQMMASIDSGIAELSNQAARHQNKIERINAYLPAGPEGGASYIGRGAKGRRLFNQRTNELRKTQTQLDDVTDQINALRAQKNKIGTAQKALGDRYTIMPDGTAFPLPFEGPSGALYKDLLGGRRTIDNLMGGTASSMWNQFRNSDWRVRTASEGNEYVSAYMRVINQQFKNDEAAMAVLRGENLIKWFGTQEGRAYRSASAMKNMSMAEHADRIEQTVEHMLPRNTPEGVALREAVIGNAKDADLAQAIKDVQLKTPQHAPDVQSEGINYAMGKGDFMQSVDSVIDKFYNVMNKMPSEVLSRNPLFFQLYRQHVSDLWQMSKDGGAVKISAKEQERIAERARQFALKDVKKLTFNMDYETKIAHSMRFIAPFFGPMQESFTRWGHIIANKPDVLAHAVNIYTSPIRAGHTVDQNGNPVDEDGYVHNEDGSKTLVSKSDMHIQFQAPQWLAKSIGMDQGSTVDMPINTLNLVLANDPWYNPGTGPWVQLPANWVALHEDPTVGDTMKKLGILQNVTPDMMSQLKGAGPTLISTILGDQDYETQQRDMAYLMQSEDYKWKTGMRSTQPTWQEVKDRVESNAQLRAWMKFDLPVSMSFKDPYQYFRDRYRDLVKADPKTADQVFMAKYGDAAFSFTGAMTYDRKGLPSTAEAVMADKKYSLLTDADPDLAPLIVGPYSSGDFSQTAYAQQMRSGERKQLSAVEVMQRAQANEGWAQYDKYMNILNARLKQAGFMSFSANGAERLDNMRKGIIVLLTEPKINGKMNPKYNEQFAKQFLTIDKSKDDRIAKAMDGIVREQSLIGDPMRSDIRSLAIYMDYRNAAQQVLANRKKAGGSADITSKKNIDLRFSFSNAVSALVEQDTKFESLYNRWLSRDMYDQHNPMG